MDTVSGASAAQVLFFVSLVEPRETRQLDSQSAEGPGCASGLSTRMPVRACLAAYLFFIFFTTSHCAKGVFLSWMRAQRLVTHRKDHEVVNSRGGWILLLALCVIVSCYWA